MAVEYPSNSIFRTQKFSNNKPKVQERKNVKLEQERSFIWSVRDFEFLFRWSSLR